MNCYIDALDEGGDEDQVRGMVDFFCELAERAVSSSLPFSVFLASRYYPKVSVGSCEELRLEDYGGHKADISEYVDNKLRIGSGQLKQQLASVINLRSRGALLWVVLVVAILNRENDRGNQHLLLTRLHEIPDDLLQLFEDLRKRDSSDNRFLPAIEWVLRATRPLEPNELYIAILTSTNVLTAENFAGIQQSIDAGAVEDFIISSSKGFLEVVADTWPHSDLDVTLSSGCIVHFIHETVREYFLVASEFGHQSLGLEHAQALRHASSKPRVTEPLASTGKTAGKASKTSEVPENRLIVSRNNLDGTPELGSRLVEDIVAISHARCYLICQTCIRISHASDLQQKLQFRHTYLPTWDFDSPPFLRYCLQEVLYHAGAASKNGWLIVNLAKDFPWYQWVFYKSHHVIYHRPANHDYYRMYAWLQKMSYEGQPELMKEELASISADAKRSQQGVETAESLLNACVSGFGSALHISISCKDRYRGLECLELLLESGANVNKTCRDVGTPLHLAIVTKPANTDAVRLLLEHGADPNAKDHRGNSPLNYAILDQHFDLVKILVAHGADLNSRIGAHGDAAQTAERLGDWRFKARLADVCVGV
ncbi:hypothetical protein Q7P35_002474 [Cladosporium inversicolor]